jgi:hypothetical protein
MTALDKSWAIQQIDVLLHDSDHVASSSPNVLGVFQRHPDKVIAQHAHVVEQILDRVTPDWRQHLTEPPKNRPWAPLRDAAARAKSALEREDEIRQHLGDGAPQLDAGQLHPWAWENGAAYWRTGHFHQAVMQAAIRINAETQAKLGRRDASETDLFNQAFSLDSPKPNSPRLRLMEDDGGKTYENLHRGARAFAEGLYSAIRNPGMHEGAGELSQQEALEQLAAFSILARWVDSATVVVDTI